MNRMLWILCCVFLLSLMGCQVPGNKGVEITIEGTGGSPELLAGTWKADRGGWEINFEPNGSISSVVHTIGRIQLEPLKTKTVPLKKGGKGVYRPGKWFVNYNTDIRELLVEIELAHFKTELGQNVVEGKSTDIFAGPVSEDGTQWQAQWFSYPEYYVTTDKYDHHKLPIDPNESSRGLLVFSKIDKSE